MRIAHVNQDPGTAPSRKKGAAVHVDAMRRAFAGLGAEVVPIDVTRPERLVAALRSAVADGPLDLIYERYALESGAAFEFAKAIGARYVLEVNSPLEHEGARYRLGSELSATPEVSSRHAMFEQADAVLAVSSAVAKYAAENGATTRNLRVQPNGVDLERFRPRQDRDELRQQLVPADAFVLGFHGRVRAWHNVPMLVSAASELIETGSPVHLLLVGEGDYAGLLAGQLPPSSYTIKPWVPHAEVGRYVACFDALVMTHSARAPFYFSPLKLYEAMAAGVPPIAPLLGDLPDIIEHGRTGLLFQPDDREALRASIRELIRDSALRARISENVRDLAAQNSWLHIARSVLAGTSGAEA
jgi:glycosyltransferase involved in cell wall biosynthesis